MIGRRTRPLLVIYALGGLFLILRLYRIQVVEHDYWRVEAARLVHSGRELPYRRGRILDTEERVLARDKGTHGVELIYREFRRGHPLGLVAHARSLLEGRPVALEEAHASLQPWAFELVGMTPTMLQAFARGEGVETLTWRGEALDDPRSENRQRRATDLGFYLRRLLGLDPREWRELQELAREEEGRVKSYLELGCRVAKGGVRTPDEAWARIAERLGRSMSQLERLSERLEWPEPRPGDVVAVAHGPLARIVAELESSRRWVEDVTASKLFSEATGFAPGRVDPELMLAAFDLSWIGSLLGWDAARIAEWTRTARVGWLSGWRDGYALPRLVWQLVLDPSLEAGPDDLLDRMAVVYAPEGAVEVALGPEGPPRTWRELEELAVFAELPDTLAASVAGRAKALPIQTEELRTWSPAPEERWKLLDSVWNAPMAEEVGPRIRANLEGRRPSDVDALHAFSRVLANDWDTGLQERLAARLSEAISAADEDELSPEGRLLFAKSGRERAAERSEHFLKDYGMRPRPLLGGEPGYDVIYLLTRYEPDFPGFVAREARERDMLTLAGDTAPLAAGLVGDVSSVGVRDLVLQRPAALELRTLKNLPQRTDVQEIELRSLIGQVVLHDEVKGVAGAEGFWNEDLSGTNGYRETRGLEDIFGGGSDQVSIREPVDGADVVLTLDADLQRAAQRTLERPVAVPEDEHFDWNWHANPVGAIVLVTTEGDVLAASSEPSAASEIRTDARGQRALVLERTLRKPTFQPPGSVFKPFVAAWALEANRLDPNELFPCAPIERGGFGYKDLRCWNPSGHGDVDFEGALVGSCNAYFARLGESLSDAELRAAAATFGFGAPTGVRTAPPWDTGLRPRLGLLEDLGGIAAGPLGDSQRRMAGNGLGVVEATPMQLARATLSLATGTFGDLRLVRRIGSRRVERRPPRPLALGDSVLERVRSAMAAVTAEPGGTAHRALAPEVLGFPIAVKTGSADLTSRDDSDGRNVRRKHTWVTGWVPAEEPEAVFVVFVHDTQATSSHGAVYLARQFLLQPEVLTWLGDHEVDVSAVDAR